MATPAQKIGVPFTAFVMLGAGVTGLVFALREGYRGRMQGLGSGRIYHAKGARTAYKNAMNTFDRAIDAAKGGRCRKALDNFAVANSDYGDFFTELKHAVGTGPARPYRGPMAAPRMKQAISNKRVNALETLSKRCLV